MHRRSLAATGVCLALTVDHATLSADTLATFTVKDWGLNVRYPAMLATAQPAYTPALIATLRAVLDGIKID